MKRVLWMALATMLALFVVGLVLIPPASAQDDATATAVAPEATAAPVEEVPQGGIDAATADLIVVSWQGLAALIGVVLTVGLTGGVGGALLIIRAARQNEAITYAMERLYLSTPPETQKHIRDLAELVAEAGYLLDDVTDGVFEADAAPAAGVQRE